MNQKEAYQNRARNRALFRIGSSLNAAQFSKANSVEHELLKAKLCIALTYMGRSYLTEAEFNGGRCDVVDLDEGVCYEVAVSESDESLQQKAEIYPLPVVKVMAVYLNPEDKANSAIQYVPIKKRGQ